MLAYILGFSSKMLTEKANIASYPPDMKDGLSTFNVYAPRLIEPVIIGDVLPPCYGSSTYAAHLMRWWRSAIPLSNTTN